MKSRLFRPFRAASPRTPCLLLLALAGMALPARAANPFLPGWEYIPDGEPKVFGDRVYLYGSHDTAGSKSFCDYILKVWSAPLADLNHWTDHGISFSTRTLAGHADDVPWTDNQLYAPDVAEKNGKYYLYAQSVGAPCAVGVSDSPAGPFKLLSRLKAPAGAPPDFGGWSQYFDPGVLVDDDGKVYLYYGGGRSHVVQLDPKTMVDVLPGTYKEDVIPREAPFNYQEGPSPRKINGIYYLVYARGVDLAYATSDSPTGPFTYRGVIVSNSGDAPGGNIHGGLAKLNGQWYIFHHRQTNNTVFSRRACAEPVTILPDGSIPQVEQTSLGFQKSLDPFVRTPADIACVLRGGNYVTETDRETRPVVNNRNDSVIGFKYFDFGAPKPGEKTTFSVDVREAKSPCALEVWLDEVGGKGTKLGTVKIDAAKGGGDVWRRVMIPVENIDGRHALYLKFVDGTPGVILADALSFQFHRGAGAPGR
jgi:hypothetical protein